MMSHDFVLWAFRLSLWIWLPVATGIFIILIVRMYKMWLPKMQQGQSYSVNGIAMEAFVRIIPALLVYIVLVVPVFYFSHQTKQEDYCMEVVRVNKMTSPDNKLLQERCSQFDLEELIARAQADK
ncbi:MAG: hypothetical protein ACRCWR_01300 [Saezia sp.]